MNRLSEISRGVSILGLERVSELLFLMGDPQERTHIVHVAGTNGKGSFTAMLSSVLKSAGYRVGSFSSPAILGANESFRIDGEVISEERLNELINRIAPFAESMSDKPTEFEVLTAAAFELFAQEGCDIAVVECGLGGAGDSTNVIKAPVLSVITNVQLDHTDRLGKTLAEIAEKKAGIIKEYRPVLFGGRDETAYSVIEKRAEALRAKLTRTDLSLLTVDRMGLDGTEITFDGLKLTLPLLGAYQPENAANVLTAVRLLNGEGLSIPESAVREGLKNTVWHARFEVLSRGTKEGEPVIIFDGSHNPDGVTLAAKSIKGIFGDKKAVLLMGVMADKDYNKYPDILREVTDRVFCVTPDNPRALNSHALAAALNSGGMNAEGYDDFSFAVRKAKEYAKEKSAPLVAMGTLYMYKQFVMSI